MQIGDGGVQVNVFAPRPEILRPWMSPAPTGPVIARPDLYTALFAGVTRDDAGPTTLTTAIEGAGGFGKTTLAMLLCQDPRVSERFTGGLLWVTVGEHSHGARLAGLISGLCEILSGDVVKTADPQAAGGRLGELLDARGPILLVVDDVWRPEQLAPFMIGGRSCRRLITTRNAGVAPRRGVSVLVDEMTTDQAIATLTDGVGEMPRDLLARLVAVTGRWPLLLSLVNAALTDQLAAGATVRQAAQWVLRRLEAGGPAAFDTDLGDEDGRSHAVRATVDASLALLAPDEQDRYLDLAVVPEDTSIPAELLSRLWHTTGGLTASEAERLRARLVRLRLVLPGWENDAPAVRLHDILGSYLRHRLTDEELAFRHELMVRSAAELLPPTPESASPWWALPLDAPYLWHHLPHHLARSGREEEREALVCDLRWVAAKIANLGSSVPVEVDLVEVPTGIAQSLRRALGSMAELLTPGDPPTALDATLYCYLSGVPALEPVVDAYRHQLSSPQLVPAWPLPDQPGLVILRTLTGHRNGVSHCAFSPDGALVATASHDRTARVWDTVTGRTVKILTGHTGAVSACAFSPDGTLLATTGHDLTARIWDITTGQEQETLTGHSESVTSCAFSPDGTLLATTSHDRTTRVWDTTTGRTVKILTGHTGAVSACAFSPDGTLLATTGHDLTARIWDITTGQEQETLTGHSESVTSCAFSPDGTLLATTSHDWKLQFWQTGAGSQQSKHALRWQYTSAFAPDGTVVATAGHDRTVRLWDVLTGDLRQMFEGHTDTVSGCAFSPDGTILATAGHDHTIRLWDTVTGTARTVLTGHTEAVADCDFSPDGTVLASASHDDTVRLWDTATGQPLRTLTGHTGAVSACVFSPDGALLASASHDHTIRLWELGTGTTRTVLRGHTNLVSSCAFSPDGALLASAGHDRTGKIWDVASGRLRQTLARHTSGVTDCVFMPDGTLVTTDIGERRLRLWRPGSEKPWCGLRVVTPLLHLAWHPDQPLLCTVGEAGVYLFRYLPHGVRDATT
ncbi:NB-ARC domain-containing protein [Streptosporangium sp. NBC_01756]|uniref:NB-ARC domain-containing protein n=1 Tax=Streptosporangium sp. NBC_01756 TaxID=2975950 RepID=UPI002DDA3A1E|nr:NB-ARC domain-containing protein [Streptosporangium sp. NBC_01756]WSC90435.1 NB-ARC domain-containing protein [Streptosporangium sp. NBC_01756]